MVDCVINIPHKNVIIKFILRLFILAFPGYCNANSTNEAKINILVISKIKFPSNFNENAQYKNLLAVDSERSVNTNLLMDARNIIC